MRLEAMGLAPDFFRSTVAGPVRELEPSRPRAPVCVTPDHSDHYPRTVLGPQSLHRSCGKSTGLRVRNWTPARKLL